MTSTMVTMTIVMPPTIASRTPAIAEMTALIAVVYDEKDEDAILPPLHEPEQRREAEAGRLDEVGHEERDEERRAEEGKAPGNCPLAARSERLPANGPQCHLKGEDELEDGEGTHSLEEHGEVASSGVVGGHGNNLTSDRDASSSDNMEAAFVRLATVP